LKFKIDENLPFEYGPILEQAGFDADTVAGENLSGHDDSIVIARCRSESRILITLDLDFSNIHSYPPQSYSGIIVFRSKSQDKLTLNWTPAAPGAGIAEAFARTSALDRRTGPNSRPRVKPEIVVAAFIFASVASSRCSVLP